jgi:ATP-dependent DNA ligase
MASKLSPGNILTTRAQKWKKDQGIISLTFDELLDTIKDKKFIAEQKVDGQSALLEYKEGKARFGSLGGRIISEIPVLTEIEGIFKNKKINQTLMVGELAGVEKGKIIHFDKTESLIKNPAKDKETLHWFPYQVLELNEEKYGEGFEDYLKGWSEITSLFKAAKYVEPVKAKQGSLQDLKSFWDKIVEKEQNEGLVVRTDDGKVYKSKPTFTYDLVVIAVGSKKGKNWPKKMIGNTLMAFMDEDHIFRVAGEIGTGWNDEEKRELFSWAQKNKAGEDDTYVWVKPQRIIEVQWERSSIKDNPAYKYERGKYEKVEKRPVGTIVKPRFIRYRKDKSVTPKDLRLTQIPNWEKVKKMAHRVASTWQDGLLS